MDPPLCCSRRALEVRLEPRGTWEPKDTRYHIHGPVGASLLLFQLVDGGCCGCLGTRRLLGGPCGAQGAKGPAGIRGQVGFQGFPGPRGAAGPQGPEVGAEAGVGRGQP
uniref:Uncharacterized protein n=1 Tax=Melopsittacus undulatus TaxID=13146 RepID=A0A8V5G6G7_MELUD